jgi:hypothetical protein
VDLFSTDLASRARPQGTGHPLAAETKVGMRFELAASF